jgi:hypothetical protein
VLQPSNQHIQSGCEAFLAVVQPDVLTQGDQGGEAVGGQRAEELVQLGSDGGIADALLVDRGGAANGKADGVVQEQEEGQASFAVAEPARQRPKERLGKNQGVGSERIAGLEDPGDPWMALEYLAQPLGQHLELLGPAQGGLQVQVDLGQDAVQNQILEQLLVADMMVQGAGNDPWRAARPRIVKASAPSWAMTANASSTTRSRVSWRRRSWASLGRSNHSERAVGSVAAVLEAAVAGVLGVARCRSIPVS